MGKYLWLGILFLIIAFIFYNSSLTGDVSYGASSLLATWLAGFADYVGIPVTKSTFAHDIRKFAHFAEFALLGIALINTSDKWRFNWQVASGYVLLFGVLTAVTDEYIQLHTPGRTAQIEDIFLDFSAVFFIWFCREVWRWSGR